MFWKDHLASEILAKQSVTKSWLDGLVDRYPSLRVKTVDANGKVPVIQLNGQGEWLKPKEWANIHVANLKQRHVELHHRLTTVGSDPTFNDHEDGDPESAGNEYQSDPSGPHSLQTKYDQLADSYVKAIDALQSVTQGNGLPLDVRTKLATMRANNNYTLI